MQDCKTGLYKGYIYCIENMINSHKYIGQTSMTILRRWYKHTSDAKKSNQVLYRAMRKYGVGNFKIYPLKEFSCATVKELRKTLDDQEIKTIKEYKDNGIELYNMTKGGDHRPDATFQPVDMYSLDGNFLRSFESISDAGNYLVQQGIIIFDETNSGGGVPGSTSIGACCRGKYHTAYGYVYRYKGEAFDKYSIESPFYKKVYKFTKNGDFIKKYPSIYACADDNGFKKTSVKVLIERKKIKDGYIYSLSRSIDISEFSEIKPQNQYVLMKTLDNKPYILFSCLNEVREYLGINDISIVAKAANGKRKTAYKHKWEYIAKNDEERLKDVLFLLFKKEEKSWQQIS